MCVCVWVGGWVGVCVCVSVCVRLCVLGINTIIIYGTDMSYLRSYFDMFYCGLGLAYSRSSILTSHNTKGLTSKCKVNKRNIPT